MRRVAWVVAVAVALVAVGAPARVRAEDRRTVGRYVVTASFAHTPVYPEELNGLILRVTDSAGNPATGLEQTLRLRVGVPNQVTETWELTPLAEPGAYRVSLALPRAGTFFFDLIGTLDGQQVNERFVSGQNGLDKVISPGRSYPRGSWIVVLFTLGVYLVGLAWLTGRGIVNWRRGRKQHASHSPV